MTPKHRGVEKLVSHRAHNPEAAGSNPAPATTKGQLAEVSCPFCVAPTLLGIAG